MNARLAWLDGIDLIPGMGFDDLMFREDRSKADVRIGTDFLIEDLKVDIRGNIYALDESLDQIGLLQDRNAAINSCLMRLSQQLNEVGNQKNAAERRIELPD